MAHRGVQFTVPTANRFVAVTWTHDNSDQGHSLEYDLTKNYFKLLQAFYHLGILNTALTNNTCPLGMMTLTPYPNPPPNLTFCARIV